MLDILYSILPIFVILVLGHLLRRHSIPSMEYWNYADKLAYWVLFPALLFTVTSTMTIPSALSLPYAVVLLGGFVAGTLTALLGSHLLGIAPATTSSVMQGAARHNTFVALAVATRLHGDEGLALAAIATAILVPVTNIVVVVGMVSLLRPPRSGAVLPSILRELGRNPILLGILLGFGVNLSGFREIPVLHDSAAMLGRAALPIMLLCVGASIRVQAIQAAPLPLGLSCLAKLLIYPLAMVALALAVGLTGLPLQIAMIYGAVATASSSYALARQMGGDAPLMAAIVTLQTLLSLITMPLTLWLSRGLP